MRQPRAVRFDLTHSLTGTSYRIFVAAPDPKREAGLWPSVLFMDGDDQFEIATKAYRAARTAAEVPPLLLVGVGYGASYTKPANKRIRDYTPTTSSDEPESGGADVFLQFLSDELWPELQRRFPVSDDARGLAGHSLGSLLVLHALFQARPFFQRFLASAPSLWWDDRSVIRAARRLREKQQTLPARLFLSVGAEDTPSMTGDLKILEEQLAAHPFAGLDVRSQHFPKRDHYNVLPDAFRAGLIALYGKE